jgi:transcriptional regulator with XRE-family HTH domain
MPGPTTEQLVRWEQFRATMRDRRQRLGLTQTEVGEAMGRGQDYVSYLENHARSIPNMATVMMWLDALEAEMMIRFR